MAAKKAKKKTKRVVKTVNWFVDAHYALKMKRDKLEAQIKLIKADISKMEADAIAKFGKEGLEGARGKKATGFIQELDHYSVDDRRKLDKYVKKSGNFELFENRVSNAAVEEIMANNKRFNIKSAGISYYMSTHFRTRKRG